MENIIEFISQAIKQKRVIEYSSGNTPKRICPYLLINFFDEVRLYFTYEIENNHEDPAYLFIKISNKNDTKEYFFERTAIESVFIPNKELTSKSNETINRLKYMHGGEFENNIAEFVMVQSMPL